MSYDINIITVVPQEHRSRVPLSKATFFTWITEESWDEFNEVELSGTRLHPNMVRKRLYDNGERKLYAGFTTSWLDFKANLLLGILLLLGSLLVTIAGPEVGVSWYPGYKNQLQKGYTI